MRFVRACPTHFSSSQHRQECAADRGSAEAERCSYGVEALAPAAGWTLTEQRERGTPNTVVGNTTALTRSTPLGLIGSLRLGGHANACCEHLPLRVQSIEIAM